MRCFSSSSDDKKILQKSIQIEEQLKKVKRDDAGRVKLLLLGTGDAGKSTFLRQIKVMHNDGFSTKEMEKYRNVLQDNTLTSMQRILMSEKVKVTKKMKDHATAVLDATELTPVAKQIENLWNEDPAVKEAFNFHTDLGICSLPSTAPYFFENAVRFADPSWTPSNEDIFRAKLKTTGISETVFQEKGMEFTIIDVGGQRSERRKWLHCFDDVTSIIYLAALDEYNGILEEDNLTNRLEESLRLFTEVTGSQFFKPCSWILFLNKSDLFKEKIRREPLSDYFTDISATDGSNYEKCCEYIRKRYEEAFLGKKLFVYVTCALDTSTCKRVFNAVKESVVTSTMEDYGFQ